MGGITVTMFLGGPLGPGCDLAYVGLPISMFWFFSKLGAIIVLNIWIRGTWPRVRVDQLMAFAWKVLLPMSILNIAVVGVCHFMGNKLLAWVVSAAILLVAFLILVKFTSDGTIEKRNYRYAS